MEKIIVQVDEDLSGLIPNYLKNQHDATVKMSDAVDAEDYEVIRVTGHGMKGTGAGYGFSEITEIGSKLEQSARDKKLEEIPPLLSRLVDYLERVEVEFVAEDDC